MRGGRWAEYVSGIAWREIFDKNSRLLLNKVKLDKKCLTLLQL
jgi:hypothetical protein